MWRGARPEGFVEGCCCAGSPARAAFAGPVSVGALSGVKGRDKGEGFRTAGPVALARLFGCAALLPVAWAVLLGALCAGEKGGGGRRHKRPCWWCPAITGKGINYPCLQAGYADALAGSAIHPQAGECNDPCFQAGDADALAGSVLYVQAGECNDPCLQAGDAGALAGSALH
eukprot:scaffold131937_cov15-Tisochrysis_lutea.AAC.1